MNPLISSSYPLTSSSLTSTLSFPPKANSYISKPNHNQSESSRFQLSINISRREAASLAFLAIFPFLAKSDAAAAVSFGISGPKDWLKEQKKKTSKYILAPIDDSRESLRAAYLLLSSDDMDKEKLQTLLRSSSRDCVLKERSSLVEFQANTGVEVCTFKLIVKNAASLLEDRDPVKLEAEAMLDDLIRSYTSLNGVANEADVQLVASRDFIYPSCQFQTMSVQTKGGRCTHGHYIIP